MRLIALISFALLLAFVSSTCPPCECSDGSRSLAPSVPEVTGGGDTTSYPCNCVLCSRSNLLKGSRDWCRCCSVLYDTECTPTSACAVSVFDKPGCEASNWMQVCNATVPNLIKDNDGLNAEDTVMDKGNSNTSSSSTGFDENPVGLILLLSLIGGVVLLSLMIGVALFVKYKQSNTNNTF